MKHIFISPRQSGKTTKLIRTFEANCEEGKNTYLLLHSKASYVNSIKRVNPEFRSNVFYVDSFVGDCEILEIPEAILIDDYFNMLPFYKKELYEYVTKNDIEVIIRATSDRLYNLNTVDLIAIMKDFRIDPEVLKEDIRDDYYYNFLTDNDATIETEETREDSNFKDKLDKEHYQTEILGLWSN